MRKALFLLSCFVAAVFLQGCGSPDSPRDVAEKSLGYLKDKQFDKYVDLLYFEEEISGDKDLLKEKKESMQELMQNKYNMSVQERGAIKEFKFLNEEVQDSTAVVKMEVSFSSGKVDTQKVRLKKLPNGNWKVDPKGK
jgi:hypothetical protein